MKQAMRAILSCSLMVGLALTGFGCANSATDQSAPGAINAKCVFQTAEDVDPENTVDHNGSKIGFCCGKCLSKWEGMDADAKAKALADAGIELQ